MSEQEIQIEIVEVNGNQYKRVITKDGEFWCLKTIALNTAVPYDTIKYHLRTKKNLFDPYILKLNIDQKSRGRPRKYLKVPNGLNEIRRCVRALRFNPIMDKILELATGVQNGTLKVATIEDIEKYKTALIPKEIQSQLTIILQEIQFLKGERKFTTQHTWVIQQLIKRYSIKTDRSARSIWIDFSVDMGISGYRDAEQMYFVPFVEYFFEKDKKIVASVYNSFLGKRYKNPDVLKALLDILEGRTKAIENLKDYL